MAAKQPITCYDAVDPALEWQRGVRGFFLQWKGIVTWGASNTTVSAALIQVHPAVAVSCIVVGLLGIGGLLMLRSIRIRHATCERFHHDFNHNVRDHVAKVDSAEKLAAFNNYVAQIVAEFYRELLKDKTITCAIRLAEEQPDGKAAYETKGRSSGGDQNRDQFSEPIPADRGLPHRLLSEGFVGVAVIPSIADAIESGQFYKTGNEDRLTGPGPKSVMVSPINGWEDSKKVMLGMLSVDSQYLAAFNAENTIPLKAFADLLGLVYPMLFSKLHRQTASHILKGPHTGQSRSPTPKKRRK